MASWADIESYWREIVGDIAGGEGNRAVGPTAESITVGVDSYHWLGWVDIVIVYYNIGVVAK